MLFICVFLVFILFILLVIVSIIFRPTPSVCQYPSVVSCLRLKLQAFGAWFIFFFFCYFVFPDLLKVTLGYYSVSEIQFWNRAPLQKVIYKQRIKQQSVSQRNVIASKYRQTDGRIQEGNETKLVSIIDIVLQKQQPPHFLCLL